MSIKFSYCYLWFKQQITYFGDMRVLLNILLFNMQSFTNTNNSIERYEHILQEQVVTLSGTPNAEESENKAGN